MGLGCSIRVPTSDQVGNLHGETLKSHLLHCAIHALRDDDQRGWSEQIPTLPEEGTRNRDIGAVPCTPLQVDL
jgi:hypothetical protein